MFLHILGSELDILSWSDSGEWQLESQTFEIWTHTYKKIILQL